MLGRCKHGVEIMNVEELRAKFETWVLSTEHKPYGWVDKTWLDRVGDSYADDYIHGLWTAYCLPRPVINEAIQWIDCKERMPEKGVDVLVRYALPWPYDTKYFVTGAGLYKPFEDIDRLFWFNGKGESMRGHVSHWMPAIDVTING